MDDIICFSGITILRDSIKVAFLGIIFDHVTKELSPYLWIVIIIKIDIWRYFNDQGLVEREEWDTDYDGNVDDTRYFEEGTIVRPERDRNNDGQADVVRYYKAGKLERKESDTNGDGQVDRWEYFTGRVLDRVGVDKDHDGTVDTWAKADAK